MAIDASSGHWHGSEPADIEEYLVSYSRSQAAYPVTAFRPVKCPRGSDLFRVAVACEVTRRCCAACGQARFVLSCAEDWDEAAEEEGVQAFACPDCHNEVVNVGVGFAGYEGRPDLDAVMWAYVGVRCSKCDILEFVNDSKVAWGPAAEVYAQA